jgi:hypothetical protein
MSRFHSASSPSAQPYNNGFYVASQASHRIRKFLEVDYFYKSTIKPFWNSGKVSR